MEATPTSPESIAARLLRLWVQERAAPVLLPYNAEAVSTVQEVLNERKALLDNVNSMQFKQQQMLFGVEHERLKFVLRSYLRTRIDKIERYFVYYSKNVQQHLLSPAELAFIKKYRAMLQKFNDRTFEGMAKQFSDLEHDSKFIKLTSVPDGEQAVFCKVHTSVGMHHLATALSSHEQMLNMEAGDMFVLPFRAIETLEDSVELL